MAKLAKMRQEKPVKNGWSRWVQPRMGKYHLACCDCGLVHEMQFTITSGAVSKDRDGGQKMHVQFRCRRAPKYTAVERKKMGIVFK